MTQSSTNTSSIYNDCWSAYAGTVAHIDDLISSMRWWDTPTALPTMYVQNPIPQVIEPHINTLSCKRFIGHKFRLGGSKK